MTLTVTDKAAFDRLIDHSRTPEESIVCRYRRAMRFYEDAARNEAFCNRLLQTTIREGARVVEPITYKDVAVYVLDETTGMATGSLKAIDGCLTSARCLEEGVERIVFESGGNTGTALTRYGQEAGLETFLFCPVENLDLLDSRLFLPETAHLAGVVHRGSLKHLARLFARKSGIRHVPDRSWRYAASMLRGLFILEQLLTVRQYDWITQTISAAFGPIGIYRVLDGFRNDLPTLPRFLGVQQEANCPMYQAWRQARPPEDIAPATPDPLLTRVMYDHSPQTYGTYEDLCSLLQMTAGDMVTVNGAEFGARCAESSLLESLVSRDIPITVRSGDIVDKTGMIALTGTFKAIDAGVIPAGSNVLCCLTGGVTGADGSARPEAVIGDERELRAYLKKIRGME